MLTVNEINGWPLDKCNEELGAACHYSLHNDVSEAREACVKMACEMGTLYGVEFFAVRVDMEYDAEEFWVACEDAFPCLSACFAKHGCAYVAENVLDQLAKLPGFSGGPAYAKNAVVRCVNPGEEYLEIKASNHHSFAFAY